MGSPEEQIKIQENIKHYRDWIWRWDNWLKIEEVQDEKLDELYQNEFNRRLKRLCIFLPIGTSILYLLLKSLKFI